MKHIFDRVSIVHKIMHRDGNFEKLPLRLNDIRDAVVQAGLADDIDFIGISSQQLGNSLPIAGRFELYDRSPGVYAPPETVAEIMYCMSLSREGMRFVVCKEMAHLIIGGATVQNEQDAAQLIEGLALKGLTGGDIANESLIQSERDGVLAAIELLCPFAVRSKCRKKLAEGQMTKGEIGKLFAIPDFVLNLILDDTYINYIAAQRHD